MSNFTETILMNVPNAILVADLNNNLVFANTAFGVLVGQRTHDFIGKSLNEVLPDIEGRWEYLIDEFANPLAGARAKEQAEFRKNEPASNYERDPLAAQTSDALNFNPPSVVSLRDQIFTYQFFDAGLNPGGDQLKGLILNDITEEKDFLDRMTQAENISSLKTLAAGISHEISNPLHSILSFSDAITRENDLDKIRLYAGKVAANSTRLGKVLSDFSGYVQGKQNGIKNEINIIDSIKSSIKFALLPYSNLKIDVQEDFECIPSFIADPEELQQVFFNIANNALQAMKENGVLKISTRKDREYILIKIKDNGPGMPADILRKVFNPFFTTKMQGVGTGLGLNITQRLVEKYGGKIEIESREGKGTEVSLYFPLPSEN